MVGSSQVGSQERLEGQPLSQALPPCVDSIALFLPLTNTLRCSFMHVGATSDALICRPRAGHGFFLADLSMTDVSEISHNSVLQNRGRQVDWKK